MRIGIFARTFSRPSLEEVLDAVVGHGIHETQFNMSVAGMPSMPDEIDPALADRVRETTAERGVTVAAVSGTFNMAHPDEGVRRNGLRRLGVISDSCGRLGTSTITLCTGTRDPKNMWRRHRDNCTQQALKDMLTSMEAALEIAEEADVVLSFEPEINNIVDSAQKGRRLLDEMRSPYLKVVMDAANLFDPEDPARCLSCSEGVLAEAFECLGIDIVLAHAKDVRTSGVVVAAGRGDLDYDLCLDHLLGAGYRGPLILHGLGEEEVDGSVTFLRRKLVGAGFGRVGTVREAGH